jgi:hypothetical protein
MNFLWKRMLLIFYERKEVVFKNLPKINIIAIDILKNHNLISIKNQENIADAQNV